MLFNPKWAKKNDLKFKGVSLSGFTAWLATMPPHAEYDYCDVNKCAVAQYRRSLGRKRVAISFPPLGSNAPGSWLQDIVIRGEWSYGAALSRARAALESQR